ncbi:MAG: CTP synthase [Candidatus Ornithospirochaeta sp.]
MAKHIFVTGGVVSGLGKGITAASLGRLLKARGFKVASQKLDPYMNVDPGTMSPLQHGEVFVTDDGAETDLDLGHYERFIDEDLSKFSNLTSGKVYWNVLNKERNGEYLGRTVQIIPHVTDEIKQFIYSCGKTSGADIVITEIGGTTGDIESQPFLEAIRQIGHEMGPENCLFIHVVLVPYLYASGEHKSKPAQHSVKELMNTGIFPDIIVMRSDERIEESIKEKISLFCNVERDCVIENKTVPVLYEAPLMLHEEGLDEVAVKKLRLPERKIDLSEWMAMVDRIHSAEKNVTIAVVGKYMELHDAYLSVMEALKHASWGEGAKIDIKWTDSETVNKETAEDIFRDVDGILVPGGFGYRGVEGKIETVKWARTHRVPFLGICLGMQVAVIEFARNVLGLKEANSSEFKPEGKESVIDIMPDQRGVRKGGTMRLGAYPCVTEEGSLLRSLYGESLISERHRHRYEFNNDFRPLFQESGMTLSGTSPDGNLVEAVEIKDHPFFIAVQFHPEFKSRPQRPHPLFSGLIKASLREKKQ